MRAYRSTHTSTSIGSRKLRTNSIRMAVLRSSSDRRRAVRHKRQQGGVGCPSAPYCPATSAAAAHTAAARIRARKTEEIVNYEISRTTKTEVIEAGRVNRISAAVLVDGHRKNDKGEVAYQPRPKEAPPHRRPRALGNRIRPSAWRSGGGGGNLRFAETTPSPINEVTGWMVHLQFTKDDIMAAAEKGVMALLGLAAVWSFAARSPGITHHKGAQMLFAAAPAARSSRGMRRCRRHYVNRASTAISPRREAQKLAAMSCRNLQHIRDDRHRQGTGPGSRPVRAEGRLNRRQEPAPKAVSIIRNWLQGRSLSHAVSLCESKKDSKPTRDDIGGLMAELSKRPSTQGTRPQADRSGVCGS